jgi:hypothetical protein
MKCPHCNEPINPAQLLGKESAKKRDTSSAAMSELAKKRWEKQKSKQ